jgi:hypothetical protein
MLINYTLQCRMRRTSADNNGPGPTISEHRREFFMEYKKRVIWLCRIPQ